MDSKSIYEQLKVRESELDAEVKELTAKSKELVAVREAVKALHSTIIKDNGQPLNHSGMNDDDLVLSKGVVKDAIRKTNSPGLKEIVNSILMDQIGLEYDKKNPIHVRIYNNINSITYGLLTNGEIKAKKDGNRNSYVIA